MLDDNSSSTLPHMSKSRLNYTRKPFTSLEAINKNDKRLDDFRPRPEVLLQGHYSFELQPRRKPRNLSPRRRLCVREPVDLRQSSSLLLCGNRVEQKHADHYCYR
jgi:hypothetical protein